MEYTFKNAVISPEARLWLDEAYAEGPKFNIKKAKVKLWAKLPKGFDPHAIDSRLYRGDHLTLIGIWHLDPKSKIFEYVEKVLSLIKQMILANPAVESVTAAAIASQIGMEERDVQLAFLYMSDMRRFWTHATGAGSGPGYSSITFSGDDGCDPYLAFESVEELMEEFYVSKRITTESDNGYVREVAAEVKRNTAFIMMPIDPNDYELEDVCNVIKDVCNKFGIRAQRADDIHHQESINEIVLKQIRESEFLVADLSRERPNVYYEIGYAHALGKRPILHRKHGTKLHFDLLVHNVPEYKNISDLKAKLTARFEAILGRKASH